MKKIKVIRLEESEQGTLGAMTIDGEAFCCTLEPSDEDNQRNISCIPRGDYVASRIKSPRFGDTFEVLDVPGRTYILFHAGNTERNTKGCVLLGQYFGKLKGERAVLNSGNTFKAFLKRMKDVDSFYLDITEAY